LRAGDHDQRAAELLESARHTVCLLVPTLSERSASLELRADVAALAARGITTLVGWGSADVQDEERHRPAAPVVEAFHRLATPDGLPAAPVWWVGAQIGQDVLIDRASLVSSVPNWLTLRGQSRAGGNATYVVTAPDLVAEAAEDVEPSLAYAARQAWHAALHSPLTARSALERCCATWVALRRPGEALSHVLKLVAGEAEALPVAWELYAVICLGLARWPADELQAMGALTPLRRSLPEFLDWVDSAAAAAPPTLPAFVAPFRELLERAAREEESALPATLGEIRRLWADRGQAEPGQRVVDVFALERPEDQRAERLRKRRP
jgi:hypothetical protein